MKLWATSESPRQTERSQCSSLIGCLIGRWTLGSSRSARSRRRIAGSSLAEVVVSMAISALSIGGISTGYIMSAQRAEWSGCSQAANSLALQRIEQVRAAKWDTLAYPAVDEVMSNNFPVVVQPLDLPMVGTNAVYATNVTTITTVSVNPPVKMIRSECTWRFMDRGVFTNTITVYRSPDQ